MTEVIDFKTKRMLSKHRKKQKEKVKDAKFDVDWVADELVKVINKSFDKKIDAFDVSLALAELYSLCMTLHLLLRVVNIYY